MNVLNPSKLQKLLAGASAFGLLVGAFAIVSNPGLAAYTSDRGQFALQETEDKTDKMDKKGTKEKSSKDSDKDEEKDDKKKKEKTIDDAVKDLTKMDGLFTLYQDPKTGKIQMEISQDQLNKEFIYISHITDGPAFSGFFRGQYRAERVFSLRKYFDRIEFVELNPRFYFDPESPLTRARDANISESVIAVAKISAKTAEDDKNKRYLIKADGLFLTEAFDQIKPATRPGTKPGSRFTLGKLSRGKSKITALNNYPENTAVDVDYVYSNPAPLNQGRSEVTDARNVTLKVQHTLIEMPENDYKPRFDDARVGYFTNQITDLTSHDAAPFRDMINRWNLVKKDPSATLSEPVEPIIWWIENTTPLDLRPTIKAAGEAWNIAFEAAGFKNAVVVKEQPDDADWDAGDVRYNILRWTSSPTPPFGGYGPSFSNPRTGQILGADIMLEYSFLTNRMNTGKVFDTALIGIGEETTDNYISYLKAHQHACSMAGMLQLNNMVGKALSSVYSADGGYDARLVKEALYYLILHEIGHTLGLNHNMKATQARSYDTVSDIDAQKDGLVGSVMDYPAINFATEGKDQAYYYTTRPGPYDLWAIQFGYSPDLNDPEKMTAHLARSTEKELAFGNDADDMRAPGKGIDPRVNIGDFSDDAVRFAADRLALDHQALKKIQTKFTEEGKSYQALRNAYLVLTGDMSAQGRVASRYIGGVYVDRAVAGQKGATTPYRPVELEKQRQGMQVLKDYIFSPSAFAADSGLIQHLAIQRRGFDHFTENEDPRIHARVLSIQTGILDHLLHKNTLQRITDSGQYGNEYTVTEMLGDLTAAIFEADSRSTVNSFRQGLQIQYVKQLISVTRGDFDYVAQSNALANLRSIRRNMSRWRGDNQTRAHRDHIAFLIDKALETHGSSS